MVGRSGEACHAEICPARSRDYAHCEAATDIYIDSTLMHGKTYTTAIRRHDLSIFS
jgi:hypothetical protein